MELLEQWQLIHNRERHMGAADKQAKKLIDKLIQLGKGGDIPKGKFVTGEIEEEAPGLIEKVRTKRRGDKLAKEGAKQIDPDAKSGAAALMTRDNLRNAGTAGAALGTASAISPDVYPEKEAEVPTEEKKEEPKKAAGTSAPSKPAEPNLGMELTGEPPKDKPLKKEYTPDVQTTIKSADLQEVDVPEMHEPVKSVEVYNEEGEKVQATPADIMEMWRTQTAAITDEYKKTKDRRESQEKWERIVHAVGQMVAGVIGLRTGLDLSTGLKFDKTDWAAKSAQDLAEYSQEQEQADKRLKTRQSLMQQEIDQRLQKFGADVKRADVQASKRSGQLQMSDSMFRQAAAAAGIDLRSMELYNSAVSAENTDAQNRYKMQFTLRQFNVNTKLKQIDQKIELGKAVTASEKALAKTGNKYEEAIAEAAIKMQEAYDKANPKEAEQYLMEMRRLNEQALKETGSYLYDPKALTPEMVSIPGTGIWGMFQDEEAAPPEPSTLEKSRMDRMVTVTIGEESTQVPLWKAQQYKRVYPDTIIQDDLE